MREEEIKIVHEAIKQFGDSFWTDFDEVEGLATNNYLFNDIVKYVNQMGYDLKLEKLENTPEIEESMEREFSLVNALTTDELSDSWDVEVVGKRVKEFISGIFVNFGMGEECIGFLTFKDSETKYSFEVGVGECLRPYDQLYFGDDENKASKIFIDTLNRLKQ
jgi:hypothetical protein